MDATIKRITQIVTLLALCLCARPASAQWVIKQDVQQATSCASPCTINWTTPTTAGSLLVAYAHFGAAAGTMMSITGGTSVHPAGCAATVASTNSADVAYTLSATGGSTTIVITSSLGLNSGEVIEYAASGSITAPYAIDGACVVRNVTVAAANLAGAAHGALTGTGGDVITQWGTFSGAASGCPNSAASPAHFPNSNAVCGLINSVLISAGLFTNTSSKASIVSIAFKATPAAGGCTSRRSLLGVGC